MEACAYQFPLNNMNIATPSGEYHQMTLDELMAPSFSSQVKRLNTPPSTVAEAIKLVHENANTDWKKAALEQVYRICQTKKEFSTDLVWERLDTLLVSTRERRAIGAIMMEAKSRGWCRSTGNYIPTTRKEAHSRPVMTWQSLLNPAEKPGTSVLAGFEASSPHAQAI